ncbi:MBL fold metallo-hydrolase [Hymenobacter psoromatis]|uniref:MBL fold metallo-hydrolase n=1 Tax=Hymenobacter psoromatis TaxID=1484116 RepID=UPI001CBF6ACF|nr:MBL fold metallo-hydrolase [Hymenobacter psoromatis]
MPQLPPTAAPAYRRFTLNDWQVLALSDGTTTADLDQVLLDHTVQQVAPLLEEAGLGNPVTISINAYLLDDGQRCLLLDTGAGDLMGAPAGHLLASLAQASYQPDQIDAVLLTHIHGDHSGGLLAGEALAFPRAQVYVNELDATYWLREANQPLAPAARQRSFANARRKLLPYQAAGQLRPFAAGGEVLPGVATIARPGHTPGHTYYALAGAGPRLVFCADLAHLITLQLADPTIALAYDVDPAQAVRSRQLALAEASAAGYWLAAAHAPFPGIGHVVATATGYRWLPIDPDTIAL